MPDLKLTMAMTPWDRIQPLIAGGVKPDGIELEHYDIPLPNIWRRQLQDSEFDISEMSMSFTLQAIPLGWDYRVLPVFHNRTFSYVNTMARLGSGIRQDHPEDLSGKRVGVVDYQMTAALWTRGILEHEFGVDPRGVEWFQGRPDPAIPGQTEPFRPPEGVVINPPPNDLERMMADGALDAMYSVHPPTSGPLADRSRFVPLFADGVAESERYYVKTGIFPVHHATIVRKSVLDAHPWVAKSLLDAFVEAQRLTMERLMKEPPSALVFSRETMERQRETFGDNPYAYGLAANEAAIDLVQTFAVEHGMTPRKQPFDELIAPSVLDS